LFSQPPTKSRHVRNVGVKTGRISRQDVLAGFDRIVQEEAINDEKEHYLAECSDNGAAAPSPIIFAVGTDHHHIERYIVFIARETKYVFKHFRNVVLCVFSAYLACTHRFFKLTMNKSKQEKRREQKKLSMRRAREKLRKGVKGFNGERWTRK